MSIWTKIIGGGLAVVFVLAMVLSYNHAISKAEDLEVQVKDQSSQINQLQISQMKAAKTLQDLTDASAAHDQAIQENTIALSKRATYIQKTYAGATDAQKNILDTHLPQFKCVFDNSCEAAAPAVPSAGSGSRH